MSRQVKSDAVPRCWQTRGELDEVAAFDQPGEAVHDAGPHAAGRCDVYAVSGVVVGVVEVEVQGLLEVVDSELFVANVGRDDRLNAR